MALAVRRAALASAFTVAAGALLLLSLALPAAADSMPFYSCTPAFCKNINDKMGFVSRTTLPNGTNINYLSWQLGFYYGLWNNGVYPNKAQYYSQPGGPFVQLDIHQEVGFVVKQALVSNISQCCSMCFQTYNCTMYLYYPTVTAAKPNGKLAQTGKVPGFTPGVNCYLLAGGNEDDSGYGNPNPYGVPISGSHSFQLNYLHTMDASFLGGLCVNKTFVDNIIAARNCSSFSCDAGASYPGKFFSPPKPVHTAFVELAPFSNPKTSCYNFCSQYNAKNPATPSSYWQYQDEGNGGTCTCYTSTACTDNGWNATAQDGGLVYSVGQVCSTQGKGDPHFKGADGSRFDFSGEPNKVYALVSDAHLQINAFFGGRYGAYNGNPRKALTWMRSVALLFGHHALLLEARAGPSAEYGSGYLGRLALDGEALPLPGVGDRLALLGGQLEIAQTKAAAKDGDYLIDEFEVRVRDFATVRLVLRPEVEELRTEEDGLVHFEVDLVKARLSNDTHGILGQTYRSDFVGRLAKQPLVYSSILKAMVVPGDSAEGFLDGSVADYQCSAIDAANCKFCRFTRAESVSQRWKWSAEGEAAVRATSRRLLQSDA